MIGLKGILILIGVMFAELAFQSLFVAGMDWADRRKRRSE